MGARRKFCRGGGGGKKRRPRLLTERLFLKPKEVGKTEKINKCH